MIDKTKIKRTIFTSSVILFKLHTVISFQQLRRSPTLPITPWQYRRSPNRHRWERHLGDGTAENIDDERRNVYTIEDGNDDDNDDDDELMDPELVSDAEALLACWAYLQKHKRLGKWSGEEERKAQASLSKGFFLWGDTYEDFLRSEGTINKDLDVRTSTKNKKDTDRRLDLRSTRNESPMADREKISTFLTTEPNQRGAQFTSLPSGPTDKWKIDSSARKRMWVDPEFRDMWYKKRWGTRKKKTIMERDDENSWEVQMMRQRKAEKRARALVPADFLGSDELASMTEEEIAIAIRERVNSNRKRVQNIKKTKEVQRKAVMKSNPLLSLTNDSSSVDGDGGNGDVDSDEMSHTTSQISRPLFMMNEAELKARQQYMSDRAKRIYSARRKNNEEEELAKTKADKEESAKRLKDRPPLFPPKEVNGHSAKLRIQHSLDLGERPLIEDVQLLLESKVRGKRAVLQKIVTGVFGLRGKCIPQENGEMGFLIKSTVKMLGHFILDELQRPSTETDVDKETED